MIMDKTHDPRSYPNVLFNYWTTVAYSLYLQVRDTMTSYPTVKSSEQLTGRMFTLRQMDCKPANQSA